MKNFEVISSNPNSKGGFVSKLASKSTVEHPIFGAKQKSLTYYISASKQLKIGSKVKESDLSMFIIKEHEMINPATGETFMGKWLHLA